MTQKANFFIVGAPKCGTTALSEYLREHPRIFMATPKEPSFFCDDLPGLRYVQTQADYDGLYSRATSGHLAVGEASPSYLFSSIAAERIHAYNPAARLVVMLRHPAEMLLSYHAQLCFSLFEDQSDFEMAWRLQAERAAGRSLPAQCREKAVLQYKDVVAYADQLERVFRHFPKEQVLIIFYDDFKLDPKAVYERVLTYLGVPYDGRTDFTPVNKAKVARWALLNQFLHSPPKWALAAMGRLSGSRLHDWLVKLHGRIKLLNTEDRRPKGMRPEFRKALLRELDGQIDALEKCLGCDLSSWRV